MPPRRQAATAATPQKKRRRAQEESDYEEEPSPPKKGKKKGNKKTVVTPAAAAAAPRPSGERRLAESPQLREAALTVVNALIASDHAKIVARAAYPAVAVPYRRVREQRLQVVRPAAVDLYEPPQPSAASTQVSAELQPGGSYLVEVRPPRLAPLPLRELLRSLVSMRCHAPSAGCAIRRCAKTVRSAPSRPAP